MSLDFSCCKQDRNLVLRLQDQEAGPEIKLASVTFLCWQCFLPEVRIYCYELQTINNFSPIHIIPSVPFLPSSPLPFPHMSGFSVFCLKGCRRVLERDQSSSCSGLDLGKGSTACEICQNQSGSRWVPGGFRVLVSESKGRTQSTKYWWVRWTLVVRDRMF